MKRKKYIFTRKKHSDKAIMSTILGMISLVSMGIVVYLAYTKEGAAPEGYGFTGLLATFFSIIGLALGVNTVQEKESYKLFPWLGTLLNLLSLGFIGLILYVGSRL